MLGYTNNQQLDHWCNLATFGICVLTNIVALVILNNIRKSLPSLYNGQQVEHKFKLMTQDISMFNNIFPINMRM